ncbi:MAG: zinc-dependent metalloprotease, partial [Phaeodactylibacter sp.]|nr:zinc-dependent metalloprotease [Phaeodactylibacter sp.]
PFYYADLIADTEIEFCLATQDPQGNWTIGITRTQTDINGIGMLSQVHYTNQGGRNAWAPNRYLNIWVADMGGGVGGRASFPGDEPLAEDGVVIDPLNFGTVGTAASSGPYNLGRTTTHEIGHYFNLEHVWGQGSPNCNNTDFVEDTPASSQTYLGECPEGDLVSCGSLEMYNNYMFYTNDACMAHFTPGQKVRMLAAIQEYRSGLLTSSGCVLTAVGEQPFGAVTVYPNPASDRLWVEGGGAINLYNLKGQLVRQQRAAPGEVFSVDVRALPAGIYYLQVWKDEQTFTQTIIKQE